MTAVAAAVRHAIEVEGLRVDLADRDVNVVRDIGFRLRPGQILGVIGESGSGKTTVGSALLGYARPGTHITGGSVLVDGVDMLSLRGAELRKRRGELISYVPQDPFSSLNPCRRLGAQLAETLAVHGVDSRAEQRERIARMLDDVRLPSTKEFLRRYPHEISGGQQQRVVIAMGFLCNPKVVVLDEPTTGLDVTTQAHVLRTVRELCERHRTAGVYVSHDLAVVGGLADRIGVMYYGRLVEAGPAATIVRNAGHPYSRGLIQVIPDPNQRRVLTSVRGRVAPLDERPEGCVFAARCDLAEPECRTGEIKPVLLEDGHTTLCRRTEVVRTSPAVGAPLAPRESAPEDASQGFLSVRKLTASYSGYRVLDDINLEVPRGLVTALVGESGSGKTTMGRCIAGLHDEATGTMTVGGSPLRFGARNRSREERRAVQYIFQNASEALNPRRSIRDSIAEPLITLGTGASPAELDRLVESLLEDVALNPRLAGRRPSELSGGERQRVTIARALATDPSLLVCDEITSALDVSVQAEILLLIERLCAEKNLTLLFVTHNLAVVRAIADRVAVLDAGVIVEEGAVDQVLDAPQHEYTQALLKDTPALSFE
ncbi:ABC transporter ATP-binding protein [Amycolatopsis sp. Poz14]|uniref:ABC transporter ATP-binding protein n=1 Tax=Amycolatopsis sp. Poz14 TaxID=1447705 RepID=UPI001EE7B49B|nr:ABC transporter ATP-binding protein [Amycolatopsis sp. Poz14]MCG3754069.1 ABC transporter ATP-binding protein [Amycolatopsis sp. Poz14]